MTEGIDPKVLDRIRKLLALARDGGATEAEANLAMSKAQELMGEHHLQEAALEAAGTEAGKRLNDKWKGRAMFKWQRDIIEAAADASYCYAEPYRDAVRSHTDNTAKGWSIIGRESSIVAMRVMVDYLFDTVTRMTRNYANEADTVQIERTKHSFRIGLAERLAERLKQRRADQEAEQRTKAQEAQRQQEAGHSTSSALTIVLEDWGRIERELNYDLLYGFPPGTTTAARKEREARWAAAQAASAERRVEKRAKIAEIIASHPGIDPRVADMMADGHTREYAEAFYRKVDRPETERQAAKRRRAEQRAWFNYQHRENRRASRFDQMALDAGRVAGDSVGLDAQVRSSSSKRIGG